MHFTKDAARERSFSQIRDLRPWSTRSKRRTMKPMAHRIPAIDRSVSKTYDWLERLCQDLGNDDRQYAYAVLLGRAGTRDHGPSGRRAAE